MESKITTEDCKNFLLKHYESIGEKVSTKDFKRTKKYKRDDFWCREFSHPKLGDICLIEKNGVLEIAEFIKNNEVKYYKTFPAEEVKWAKSFMKKYEKDFNDGEDLEYDEDKEFLKRQSALASQFTFFFPIEEYENVESNKKNGLDTLMLVNGMSSSFSVVFVNKNKNDMDFGMNDVLRYGVLPEWMDFADETNVMCAVGTTPPGLTVRDFVKILFDLGFEYKADKEYFGCLFEKEINLFFLEKKLQNTIQENNDDKNKPKI